MFSFNDVFSRRDYRLSVRSLTRSSWIYVHGKLFVHFINLVETRIWHSVSVKFNPSHNTFKDNTCPTHLILYDVIDWLIGSLILGLFRNAASCRIVYHRIRCECTNDIDNDGGAGDDNEDDDNSVHFFIYLRAELNRQWPITESARIQTTALRKRRKKQTNRQ
jgi:hypothetical protein